MTNNGKVVFCNDAFRPSRSLEVIPCIGYVNVTVVDMLNKEPEAYERIILDLSPPQIKALVAMLEIWLEMNEEIWLEMRK